MLGIAESWGLVIEAKRTRTGLAEGQLLRYQEICAEVWPGRRWVLVQVFRTWRPGEPYRVTGPGQWKDAKRMIAWHFQAS